MTDIKEKLEFAIGDTNVPDSMEWWATREMFLQSLGLFWRVWPEEKPTPGEKVYVERLEISDVYLDFGELSKGNVFIDGDRFLPLKALECLP